MLVLLLSRELKKTYPTNYILLGAFTICESYLVSAVTAVYEPIIVFEAILVTAAIVAALTLYAFTTKHEITYFMGLIWMLCLGSFFVAIVGIFSRAEFIHLFYALIGTVLAGLYLIYDIKAIMGEHRTFKVDIDDYIGGALNLYIDIIRIFLKVLEFLGKDEKDKKKK
jgi:FtsH-binding integral membrane protein